MTALRLAVAVVVCGAGVAHASPRLVIDDGAACDASALGARVDALTGGDRDDARAPLVRVAIARDERGVSGRVATDGAGERVVEAATCDDLIDQLALVIAVAIRDAPAPAAAVAPPPPPRVAAVARAVEPAPRAADDVRALAVGTALSVPPGDVAGELVVGVRVRRARVSVGVEASATTPDRVDVGAMSRIDVWTAAVAATACLHAGPLAGCALASAGVADGSPHALAAERGAVAPLVALGGRVVYERALTARTALDVHADLAGEVVAATFDVDGMPAWSSHRAALWLGIDVLAQIP
jgi:hypothetical protein|nr:hypothetical protein [Kofleriaceae bacterium]